LLQIFYSPVIKNNKKHVGFLNRNIERFLFKKFEIKIK